MAREIKFRMWDYENGQMVDGDSLAFEEYAPISHLLTRKGIMQYTGFKSPDGKEVYEGDVVKTKSFYINKTHIRVIGKVEHRRNGFAVVGIRKYNGIIIYDFPYDLEVIGNIYEHPHLLKEDAQHVQA